MKLVQIDGNDISSHSITESEFYDLWNNSDWKKLDIKSPYELCRLERKISNKRELIIVYRDNRQVKTRNTWKEYRVLRAFANFIVKEEMFTHKDAVFEHSVPYKVGDDFTYSTEVDGRFKHAPQIGIEIKGMRLNQKMVDFFINKLNMLQLDHLHLFAPNFAPKALENIPKNLTLWTYNLDYETLTNYYNTIIIPDFIQPFLGRRHIRFLMTNGRWKSIKTRLTSTKKHTTSHKLKREINRIIIKKNNRLPVKIYYSLARVIDPLLEFRGKGYPINEIVIALDIDATKHQHIIDKSSMCQTCLKDATLKLQKVQSYLEQEKISYLTLLSGAKGFHIYLLDSTTKKARVSNAEEMIAYVDKFSGLVDDFRAQYSREWDFHRIFKLPGTIDASTGQKILPVNLNGELDIINMNTKIKQNILLFNDKIKPITPF
ncbi:MAG: hypothetical protein ACXAC7_12030 [Candidatus Hodarchaeales archaeon]|jgi:hypothetical protein